MAATTSFRYDALSPAGQSISGTIEATNEAAARDQLRQLGLAVRRFEPVSPARTSPLSGEDLIAFNEQLGQLAKAGLPVEQGLRLLAGDMSRGRLRTAVAALAHDLDGGATLAEAVQKHRRAFPPLYARLIDAGVRSGNLPGALFNLSKHLDLTRRIRAALTRSLAYPAAMFVALVIISAFLSAYVLPPLISIFENTRAQSNSSPVFFWVNGRSSPPPLITTPWVTTFALLFGKISPLIAIFVIVAVVGWMLLWPTLRSTRLGLAISDSVLTRLPLIGPAIRFSLVGRWCDAARLGVEAGMDLPAAFALASDTIGSQRLTIDANELTEAVSRGAAMSTITRLSMLPPTVPATIDLAGASGRLGDTLGSLASIYLRQAEHRARLIPLILTPILTLLVALMIGTLMAAMFIPMTRLLQGISGF